MQLINLKSLKFICFICLPLTCDRLSVVAIDLLSQDCGISLKYIAPKLYHRDLVSQIIASRSSQNSNTFPTIVHSRRFPVLPIIFRSMRYDCFIYVQIETSFSFMDPDYPPYDKYFRKIDIHFTKAVFIFLLQKTNPLNSIGALLKNGHYMTKPFVLIFSKKHKHSLPQYCITKSYFICFICGTNYYLEIAEEQNLLGLSNLDFRKEWDWFIAHDWLSTDHNLQKKVKCALPQALDPWVSSQCLNSEVSIETLLYATMQNASIQYSYDYTPGTHIGFRITQYPSHSYCVCNYNKLYNLKIVYCIYNDRVDVENSNIFLTPYTPDVWSFLLLCLVFLSIIKTLREPLKHNDVRSLVFNFLSNISLSFKMLVKQSEVNRDTFMFLMEFLAGVLLPAYENFITSNLVVPSKEQPFRNFTELMANGYTFLYDPSRWYLTDTVRWVKNEFGVLRVNNATGITANMDSRHEYEYINTHFRKQAKKFAFLDTYFEDDFYVELVSLVFGHRYTCLRMIPPEESFAPLETINSICSTLGELINSVYKRLLSAGVYEFEKEFFKRRDLNLTRELRLQMWKYNTEWVQVVQQKEKEDLRKSTISFKNLNLIFIVGITLLSVTIVNFVLEMSSRILKIVSRNFHKFVQKADNFIQCNG